MISTLVTLVTLSTVIYAQSIDNTAQADAIKNAAVQFNGDHTVTNAATGQVLSFDRTSVTNFFVKDTPTTVNLQQATGDGVSGTIFAGMGKCASAQWNVDSTGGHNHAAVSYACQIGSSADHTGSIHLAKQLWQVVPCGGSASSSNGRQGFAHAAAGRKSAAVHAAPQSIHSHAATSNGKPCRHTGTWLSRHSEYVHQQGHTECAATLAAYQSSHHRMVKKSQASKRASGQTYCIIASDHLPDMTTRALGSGALDTFGGYTSQELVVYDPNDVNQRWFIN